VGVQRQAPAALPPGKRPDTQRKGGSVGLGPVWTSAKISSPHRSETLHRSFFKTLLEWRGSKAEVAEQYRWAKWAKSLSFTVTDARTLVVSASSPSSFKCYSDPQYPHNHDCKAPLWPAHKRKTIHLQLGIKLTLNSEDGETLKITSSRIRRSYRSCVKDNEMSRKSSRRCITKPWLKANSTVHVCSYTSYHYFHCLSHCPNNYIQGLTTLHSPYHHTTVTGLKIRTYRQKQNAHKKSFTI